MVEPTEKDIGEKVARYKYIYSPEQRPRPPYKVKREVGIITSFNERFVFVRYDGETQSRATRRKDLEWAFPLRKPATQEK